MNIKDIERFKVKSKDGKEYFQFNTLYEFGDLITESYKPNVHTNQAFQDHKRDLVSLKDYNEGNRYGTRTMDEAVELLKYGWEYGAKKINSALKILSNSKSIKLKYDIVGSQVSVPRMLQGLPTHMIHSKMVEKKAKILNVYKDIGYNTGYTGDQIIDESAKALQIVELLEAKGYRVNLYVICGFNQHNERRSKQAGETLIVKVKVKNSSERINVKKVAFCLANPAFLRRLAFRILEIDPAIKNPSWVFGYGYPMSNEDNEQGEKYSACMEDNRIFIPIKVGDVEKFVENINKA